MKKEAVFLLMLCIACAPQIQTKEVTFCPKKNCTTTLANELANANTSISCAFFELNLPEIIKTLSNKSKSISVKVVLDNRKELPIEGPNIKTDTRSALMHHKFCVIDKKKVTTGSFNPTKNGAYKNNNNLLIIEDLQVAQAYQEEFFRLWEDKRSPSKSKNPYFCPKDNCVAAILEELRNAKHSIYFMTFSFTHNKIAQQLVLRHHENISIQGIMEKRQGSKHSQFTFLKNQGISVQWDSNPHNMHHKVFIIDNQTIITGSFNPSNNAAKNNNENIFIVQDPILAKKYLKEFYSLQESEIQQG